MKVKVCGMKYPENVKAVTGLSPDYIGFIFYSGSKRFAGESLAEDIVKQAGVVKVGVFVNEKTENIHSICKRNNITHVQLHGEESPEQCSELKNKGYIVIKVFSVGEDYDFAMTKPYEMAADFYLFDTKSDQYGGTGKKFNWNIFQNYDNSKEIFLSGGIGPMDVEEIRKLSGLKIHAVDINSKFETEPGVKNIELIKPFIQAIKNSTI